MSMVQAEEKLKMRFLGFRHEGASVHTWRQLKCFVLDAHLPLLFLNAL